MIKVKVDVSKLDKTAFFKGAKGTYVDLVLWENKGGKDQYGNDFSVKQDMPKERRGEKTPIIGNAKFVGTVQPSRPQDLGPPVPPWPSKEAKFTPGGGHVPPAPMSDTEEIPFAPFKF